jgi:hypothetical protein
MEDKTMTTGNAVNKSQQSFLVSQLGYHRKSDPDRHQQDASPQHCSKK